MGESVACRREDGGYKVSNLKEVKRVKWVNIIRFV
jgi:hypothetical protein